MADVCLSSDVSVYGFQFDMALPEGVSLQGVTLDESRAGAAGSDILKFTRLKSGLYRVLCASTSDIPFAVNDAPAIRMTIAAENGVTDGDYDMTLSGIVLSTDNDGIYPEGFTVPFQVGTPTCITEVDAATNAEVDVYSVNGTLLRSKVKASRSLEGLPRGIYIINGKAVRK